MSDHSFRLLKQNPCPDYPIEYICNIYVFINDLKLKLLDRLANLQLLQKWFFFFRLFSVPDPPFWRASYQIVKKQHGLSNICHICLQQKKNRFGSDSYLYSSEDCGSPAISFCILDQTCSVLNSYVFSERW